MHSLFPPRGRQPGQEGSSFSTAPGSGAPWLDWAVQVVPTPPGGPVPAARTRSFPLFSQGWDRSTVFLSLQHHSLGQGNRTSFTYAPHRVTGRSPVPPGIAEPGQVPRSVLCTLTFNDMLGQCKNISHLCDKRPLLQMKEETQ